MMSSIFSEEYRTSQNHAFQMNDKATKKKSRKVKCVYFALENFNHVYTMHTRNQIYQNQNLFDIKNKN